MSSRQRGAGLEAGTLIDLLEERSRGLSEARAYTFLEDGEAEGASLTFRQVGERARAIGARLQSLGLAGERVLLLYPPGLEFVTAFLGCLYGGVVAVPAYPPRSARTLPRLLSIVKDARPAAALTVEGLAGRIAGLLEPGSGLDPKKLPGLQVVATDGLEAGWEGEWRDPGAGPGDAGVPAVHVGLDVDPEGRHGAPRQPGAQRGPDPARASGSRTRLGDRGLAAAVPRHGADRQRAAAAVRGRRAAC